MREKERVGLRWLKKSVVGLMVCAMMTASVPGMVFADSTSTTEEIGVYKVPIAASGFTKRNQNVVQTDTEGLRVKYNGETGANTRYAYVKFDLTDIKEELDAPGTVIEKVTFKCNAKLDRVVESGHSLYVKRADETNWTTDTLTQNTAPAIGDEVKRYGGSTNLTNTIPKESKTDATDYVMSRMETGNTATFAFTTNYCQGESLYVLMGENTKPELIIEAKKVVDIDVVQLQTEPFTIQDRILMQKAECFVSIMMMEVPRSCQ